MRSGHLALPVGAARFDLHLAVETWRCPLQRTAGEDASQDDGKEEDDAEEEKDSSYKI